MPVKRSTKQRSKPKKVDTSSSIRDEGLQDGCPSDPDIPTPTSTREYGTRNHEEFKSNRLWIFVIGLALGFGLGWFAAKYHGTDSCNMTVKDYCANKSLDEEDLAKGILTGDHIADYTSPPLVDDSAETSPNLLDQPNNIKSEENNDENVDGNVNLDEELKLTSAESFHKEPVNNDLDDLPRENAKEEKTVSYKDKLEDQNQETSETNHRQGKVLKTFTYKDGKIQENGNEKSPDKEKIPTVKKKRKENRNKERNQKDSIAKDSFKSSTVSHTPKYLQGLEVGYSIRVGENVVSPQELTNGTGPVRVYIYESFLTPKECEGLIGAHNRHVVETNKNDPLVCFDGINTLRKHLKAAKSQYRVSEQDFTKGTTCMNATFSKKLKKLLKWSYSTAFYPGENRFSTTFEKRVLEATGLKPENGGKLQITSYQEGIGYKTHTDCTIGSVDKRDRVATILVYLQDVAEGGETKFPELNISVRPVKGRALVWNNMNPTGDCQPLSIHEAAQVKEGHKYILQRWYYYENFYHLGKRPSEPSLPERTDGQPRVSCDEYENGSCRWYDEWNYDHIVDYQASKSTLV